MPGRELTFPALDALDQRHFGVTQEVGAGIAMCARVCLYRHHKPPTTAVTVSAQNTADKPYAVTWLRPTQRQIESVEKRDATRDGAYCLALGASEIHLGLFALGRAQTGTGADYYLGPSGNGINVIDGELDWERAFRLEVSGIDRCSTEARLRHRLREKLEQARRGRSNLPAMAVVVAFDLRRIVFQEVQTCQ